ncbi:MAG TPA: cation:proton antiporter [Gemmatimonadaceae bacterium]
MHGTEALLTIAWAAAAGLLAQVLGARLRLPSIVLLLALGVLLGPAALGVVHPASIAGGLPVIVKLVVAIVLFDGALNLRLGDLRHSAAEVRNLILVGVPITLAGGTLAAHLISGLSWTVALVFGALVTVTGPTVVQPLLRRVELPRRVKATLEGEAILVDPLGALLAVALVDIVLGLAGSRPIGWLAGAWAYLGRLSIGLGVGVAGGLVLSQLLRRRRLVPVDFANLAALTGLWSVFALAEALHAEAGIMAAVAMGLTLQRSAVPEERRLRRFKEQITILGIGLLFILLAAGLPVSALHAEGWRGVMTVAVLMVVVRPLSVAVALRHSALSRRERIFVACLAPRGIVAASVASIFALALLDAGFAEGPRLLALTFLTVAMTVTLQGLTAAPLAQLLRLKSMSGHGAVVVGAGPLGRVVAAVLREHGRPVVLVDRNAALVDEAKALGFDALTGNALDETTLEQAGTEDAETLVAVTTNSEVNALAAHLAHDAFGVARAYPALAQPSRGAGEPLLERVGGRLAFGRPVDVRRWESLLGDNRARVVRFAVRGVADGEPQLLSPDELTATDDVVPIARLRSGSVEIITPGQSWREGDEVVLVSRLPEADTIALLRRRPAQAPMAEALVPRDEAASK